MVATIPVGGLAPVGVAITPDGTRAYVTNAGSENVSVINTATHTVSALVRVGAIPLTVAFTPDGSSAYVANAGGKSVSVINTGTNPSLSCRRPLVVGKSLSGRLLTPMRHDLERGGWSRGEF